MNTLEYAEVLKKAIMALPDQDKEDLDLKHKAIEAYGFFVTPQLKHAQLIVNELNGGEW